MEAVPPRRKLRVSEAAEFTGLSRSFLNKLRSSGGGPAFLKVGRRVLYDILDLELWLAHRRRQSTSDMGGEP